MAAQPVTETGRHRLCASTPMRGKSRRRPAVRDDRARRARVLRRRRSDLGVSDIARRLGIAKSTAHRVLTTLAGRGFIEQDPDSGRYRLGLHLYELGQLTISRNPLRHARPATLRQIAAADRPDRQPRDRRRP
jgi:predicted ArsR family transcriptional regulator